MCLAIFKPKDIVLTKALLKKAYNNNSDGCGFATPDDVGKSMVVQRGLFSFREFWKAYREIPKEKPVLIHFRIATSGQVDESNCHPFLIDKRHALVHNGSIERKLDNKTDDTSDTAFFVEQMLRPPFVNPKFKKKRFWASPSFKWLMENSIGYNNKIVILDASGFEVIYNVEQGEWEHGAWFSNKSYKEDRKKTGATVKEITENGWRKKEITLTNGTKQYEYLYPVSGPATSEERPFALPLPPSDAMKASHEFQEELLRHPRIDIGEMY